MAQVLGSDLLAIQRVEGISLNDVAQVYSVSIKDLSLGFDDLFVKIEGDEMTGALVINDTTSTDSIVFDVKGENNDDPDGSIFIVRKDNVRDQAFYLTTLDMLSNPYEVANKKYVDSKTGGAIRYEYNAPVPPLFSPVEGDIWIDKSNLMMYVYDQAVDSADNPVNHFEYVALTGQIDSGQIVRSEAYISDTPPSLPSVGDLWFDSALGELRIYYGDIDSEQWVSVNNAGHDVAIDKDIKDLVTNVDNLITSVDQLVQAVNALTVTVDSNTQRIEQLEILNPNTIGTVTITGPTSAYVGDSYAYNITYDGTANNVEIEFSSSDDTDTLTGFAVEFGLPGTRTLTAKITDKEKPFDSTGTLDVEVVVV